MSRRLQRNLLNSGGDTFFGGNGLLLWFWVSAFNSLSLFYHLATFLLKKQDSPMPPNSVATSASAKNRVAVRRYLLAFGCCDCHCRLCGRLFECGFHQHVPPHPLEAKPPPSYHLGSGRRPEKSHFTELLHTLYTRMNVTGQIHK
jgi:hypothetical protein